MNLARVPVAQAHTGCFGATKVGTNLNNVIYGDDGNSPNHSHDDLIDAKGGHDFAKGFQCRDDIYGRRGVDLLHGGGGADMVFGGYGDDHWNVCPLGHPRGCGGLEGGPGWDLVRGGGGKDTPNDDATDDKDELRGGNGADTLDGKDGDIRDTIKGGDGWDICERDVGDDVLRCESIR